MIEQLIRQAEDAIECSRHWAEKGWTVTFGSRNVAVSSLKEAQALEKSVIFRDEALNYWKQAEMTGNDAADSGVMGVAALKSNKLGAADDAFYLCRYIEKPFAESAGTWAPLYEAFKERVAGQF